MDLQGMLLFSGPVLRLIVKEWNPESLELIPIEGFHRRSSVYRLGGYSMHRLQSIEKVTILKK
ncbi:MAG: hypothetical protein QF495_04560 [SAR324 cluster bacterium]|nr:hypothetical protein [SAR324 cluster bacterium]